MNATPAAHGGSPQLREWREGVEEGGREEGREEGRKGGREGGREERREGGKGEREKRLHYS